MKNKLSWQSKILLRDEVLFADLDWGEGAILNLRDGIYYGLNPVATRIWHLIEEGKRVSEIGDLLLTEFSVESDRLTRDLIELIEQLAGFDLVEVSSETTT